MVYETHIDYAMEFAEGGRLEEVLSDKTRALQLLANNKRVGRLLRGVLSALVHLHDNCLVHRDLAARSILLTTSDPETQEAKLADWGLMREVPKSSLKYKIRPDANLAVTIMPPECFVAQSVDVKADSWSFGLLLHGAVHESLTLNLYCCRDLRWHRLSPARDGRGRLDCAGSCRQHATQSAAASAPEAIQKLAQSCFEQDPMKRPSSKELLDVVEAWLKSMA